MCSYMMRRGFVPQGVEMWVTQTSSSHTFTKTKGELGLPAYSILYYEVLLSKCEQVLYS